MHKSLAEIQEELWSLSSHVLEGVGNADEAWSMGSQALYTKLCAIIQQVEQAREQLRPLTELREQSHDRAEHLRGWLADNDKHIPSSTRDYTQREIDLQQGFVDAITSVLGGPPKPSSGAAATTEFEEAVAYVWRETYHDWKSSVATRFEKRADAAREGAMTSLSPNIETAKVTVRLAVSEVAKHDCREVRADRERAMNEQDLSWWWGVDLSKPGSERSTLVLIKGKSSEKIYKDAMAKVNQAILCGGMLPAGGLVIEPEPELVGEPEPFAGVVGQTGDKRG